jgi:hypothetical protein
VDGDAEILGEGSQGRLDLGAGQVVRAPSDSTERRPVDVCDAARASCRSSISAVPSHWGRLRPLRRELRKVAERMRYSHALRCVPSWNRWNEA